MIKNWIKKILNLINYESVSVFCKIHFRKQAKRYIRKNQISPINSKIKRQIKNYWHNYTRNATAVFHQWYIGANSVADVRYIPEDFFYDKIERFYNDLSLEPAYADKSMFKKLLPDVKQPETYIVNINGLFYDNNYGLLSFDRAIDIIVDKHRYVIKPTRDTGGGKNVRFVSDTYCNREKIRQLFAEYKQDYIIQKPLTQHKQLAQIHEESINTIRVMSMLEQGKVSIVSTVLRMGVGDSCVDNECSGGINCGVDQFGRLSKIAYDGSGKRYDKHPQGFEFEKGIIPSYDRVINVIKESHLKLPYFGLISWDFTVDDVGDPVMIELNLRWCGLNFHQLHDGPLFGDRTDEILKKVCFSRGKIS